MNTTNQPTVDLDDIFMNLTQTQPSTPTSPQPKVKALNEKAMSVQLVTSKPTTRFNDEDAAKVARSALGDEGIAASTTLFKDRTNPVRHLLNEVNAVYVYHKQHTIPYIDRGPRLLPVNQYENYRDSMRVLIADVDARLANVMADYDLHVRNDVAYRNSVAVANGQPGRAKVEDYPTAEDFKTGVHLAYTFAPLPDNSHWLFDVSEEDKAALTAQSQATYQAAIDDLKRRIQTPLDKLVSALCTADGQDETGKRTGIFRNTKITNVADAVANVKALSMGDEGVVAACEMVETAIAPLVKYPDVVRESPVVREQAAKRLAEVASKMGAFFGETPAAAPAVGSDFGETPAAAPAVGSDFGRGGN